MLTEKTRAWVVLVVLLFFGLAVMVDRNNALNSHLVNQQQQNTKLLAQIDDLQSKVKKMAQLENELKEVSKLKSENIKLQETINSLVEENNKLLETVNAAAQTGTAKPQKTGITPKFTTVSRGGFHQRETLKKLSNLAQGSYQYQKEEILLDINDRSSWQYAGNWYVTRYTATPGECDSDPSTTADGKLVTPGFTVAVDPKYWKYGTIFYFEGLGFGVAADCGGAVKGKSRADFLVASKKFSSALPNHRDVWVIYVPAK